MNYVSIFVATVLEVSFSVLKKGGVPIFLSVYCMYKSLVFDDAFLVQGLHVKKHGVQLDQSSSSTLTESIVSFLTLP